MTRRASCLLSFGAAMAVTVGVLVTWSVLGIQLTWLYAGVAILTFLFSFALTTTLQLRRPVDPADAWHIGLGFDIWADFCIWVLELDGLHVPPFNHHPQHAGPLQALGLTPEMWQAWVERVLEQPRIVPPEAWPGNPVIRDRLRELWVRYGPMSNTRRGREQELLMPEMGGSRPTLWDELQPYRGKFPPLRVVLVAYPTPVEYVLPPATLILGVSTREPDRAGLRASILRGAKMLASHAQSDTTPNQP